jgi:hypothetical protein
MQRGRGDPRLPFCPFFPFFPFFRPGDEGEVDVAIPDTLLPVGEDGEFGLEVDQEAIFGGGGADNQADPVFGSPEKERKRGREEERKERLEESEKEKEKVRKRGREEGEIRRK